jgi:hypothetical protein
MEIGAVAGLVRATKDEFLMRDSHVLAHGMNFQSLFKNIQGARASWLAKDATVLA